MKVNRDSPKPTNGRHTPERPITGGGSAPNNTDDGEQGERTIPDELKLLFKQFRELGVYFSYFVTAKTDSVKLSLRYLVLWVVLAALGFVAVGGLIVIASWLMLSGLAEGLGGLLGNRAWAGSFITGILLLAGLGLGICCTVAIRNRIARERTAQKYERLTSQKK
jgi:hypothetical protein